MTTPKTGDISLNKVRSDLGLSPGSLIDRAVCNRAGFSKAAKPSLESHRGFAFAPQASVTGGLNATVTRRDTGYQGTYPNPSGSYSVTSTESGNGVTVTCKTAAGGYDPDVGNVDASIEFRQAYYMPLNGNFRLTGDITLEQDANYNSMSWSINVLGFSTGYLQGDMQDYVMDGGKNSTSIDEKFTTRSSRPYVVLILRIIGRGGNEMLSKRAIFKNMKVKYQ